MSPPGWEPPITSCTERREEAEPVIPLLLAPTPSEAAVHVSQKWLQVLVGHKKLLMFTGSNSRRTTHRTKLLSAPQREVIQQKKGNRGVRPLQPATSETVNTFTQRPFLQGSVLLVARKSHGWACTGRTRLFLSKQRWDCCRGEGGNPGDVRSPELKAKVRLLHPLIRPETARFPFYFLSILYNSALTELTVSVLT